MQAAEASKIVSFMSKVKMDNDPMKAWVMNAMNALMSSPDPVSIRFCQLFNESLNKSAVAVINESAGAPPVIPSAPAAAPAAPAAQPANPATAPAGVVLESIMDRASMLMI